GANTFSALQWRIAEVNSSAAHLSGVKRLLEINASFDSGELGFASQFRFPTSAAIPGHTYRVRVRHKDTSGRWSRWSAPVEFAATAADGSASLQNLVVSEVMYHPVPATAEEAAAGFGEQVSRSRRNPFA
ncbi:MAG: hypothetical protein V4710_01895, partial [Verrucomicrobiota bacterium]